MHEKRQWIDDNGEVMREERNHFTDSMTEEGYRFPSHKAGARMFEEVPFPSGVSKAEIGCMAILAKAMIGQTNMIGYRQGHNIYAYTVVEIGELVGLHRTRAIAFVNRMIKQRMMQRILTTSGPQYYINPAYFMASGRRLSLDLFLLFRDDLKHIVPGWVMADFLRQAREKQTKPVPVIVQAEGILRGQV